jgi:hypothetical protein
MKNARPLNLASGTAGSALVAGGLLTGDTLGIIMALVGAVLALIAGNVPPDPPEKTSASDMARRSGTLIVLGLLLSACAGPPPPPAHVSTTVEIEGSELDTVTRWTVCASARVCATVDVGLLWGEDRVVCIELPEYGLLTCHDLGGGEQ